MAGIAKRNCRAAMALALCALPNVCLAAAGAMELPPHDSYSGARALGLGNAFVAIGDDESAIFSNPAGIGREDGDSTKTLLHGASFPNVTAAADRNPAGLQTDFMRMDATRTDRFASILSSLNDASLTYARATLFPYATIGRFQLGLLMDEEMQAFRTDYDTPQTSQFDGKTYTRKLSILNRSQTGAVVGFSIPHKTLGMSFGVSVRATSRSTLMGDFESSDDTIHDSAETLSKGINKSRGIAVDTGLQYRIAPTWQPTLGIAVKDVGNSFYRAANSNYKNEIEKMNMVMGMSVRPKLGKYLGAVVSAEGDRLNDSRVSVPDKMHFGLEVQVAGNDVTAPFALRTGMSGGAPSYGASADLLFFKIDFARYGEYQENSDGELRLDMRTIARISVDLRT